MVSLNRDGLTGKILAGERISTDDAQELYGWPLEELGVLANARRDLAKAKNYGGRGREIITEARADAEGPLDRPAEGERIGLRAQIVHPLHQRDDLLELLLLGRFLDSGVQVADFRHDAHDGFAVNLQDKPQNAMRRRVLWPHVQDKSFLLPSHRFEHCG